MAAWFAAANSPPETGPRPRQQPVRAPPCDMKIQAYASPPTCMSVSAYSARVRDSWQRAADASGVLIGHLDASDWP
eukprot:scaffold879_cov410-Prasinococcus_capsulatus_cf.AAC.17